MGGFHSAALAILAAAAFLPGQDIRVTNLGGHPYRGWATATLPDESLPERGHAASYAVGRKVGRGYHLLHLRVDLDPGEVQTLTLEDAHDADVPNPVLPAEAAADPLAYFGRLRVLGTPLEMVSATPDGPSLLFHLRARVAPLLVADAWVQYYPGQAWAPLEVLLTASNVTIPDTRYLATEDVVLEADAQVQVSLRGHQHHPGGPVLLPAGTTIGTDQGFPYTGTILWVDRLTDYQSAGAWVQAPILASAAPEEWAGHFGPYGMWGELPPRFQPRAWVQNHLGAALDRLDSWDAGPLGPAASSTVTGAQEDQGFVKCSETFHPDGNGAQFVRYLVALKMAHRPVGYRDARGGPIHPGDHPSLVLWNGRPHWHTGVSPDQLGKPSGQSVDWHGWFGPDREHWLVNTLCGSYLLTGSPLLQQLIHDQSTVVLLGETVDPRLSTSHSGAPRGVGWTMLACAWIWHCLDSDATADALEARVRARAAAVLVPELTRPDTWDVRYFGTTTDNRIMKDLPAAVRAWIPWQHAIAAMGLEAGHRTWPDIPGLGELARQAARTVVDHGWSLNSTTYTEWDAVGEVVPGEPPAPSAYRVGSGWVFRSGWFSEWCAAACPLDVGGARAAAILEQVRAGLLGGTRPLDWTPRWN